MIKRKSALKWGIPLGILLITLITMIRYFEINPFRNHLVFDDWEIPAHLQLEVGDIVFRTAYGKESRMVTLLSGGDYSHIAVITDITPEIMVTHATTNDNPDKLNQVLLTPITEFLSPTFAKRFEIARPNFLSHQEKSHFGQSVRAKVGEAYVLLERALDNLYCTTLLEVPLKTLIPALNLQWQQVDIPGLNGEYLFPDAFLELPQMHSLFKQVNE